MLFNFKLKPPQECQLPSGDVDGDKRVCWFYLTDSEYFIDLGGIKLFQSSPQWIEKCSEIGEYLDYYYSRQLEDLFEILPTIACPMPAKLYNFINTDEKLESLHEKALELYLDAIEKSVEEKYGYIIDNLTKYGYLDSGYIRFKTYCQFFNVDGMVTIRYDFIDEEDECPVWSASKGIYTIKYSDFVAEIEDLLNRFYEAMDKQVDTAMQVFNERELKDSNLIAEHAQRKEYFYGILQSMKDGAYESKIDWHRCWPAL